jgi:hypothetical protein|tara:strand:- start:275 stop:601 length:327 start_codon:yes stop_codon:yes gene_type:complete
MLWAPSLRACIGIGGDDDVVLRRTQHGHVARCVKLHLLSLSDIPMRLSVALDFEGSCVCESSFSSRGGHCTLGQVQEYMVGARVWSWLEANDHLTLIPPSAAMLVECS